jgi:hypothetical protein
LRVRLRLAIPTLALAALLAGCPRSTAPSLLDGGASDARDFTDTDDDGLCDPQEAALGTRSDDPDTDGDGFSDLAEVSLGFDAQRPGSPDRDLVVYLSETTGSTARVSTTFRVSGMGESFTGTFIPARQAFEDGGSAMDFYGGAAAVGATPSTSVFAIEGETFERVIGRAVLVFSIDLESSGPRLGCTRAYPFLYQVKRADGVIVGQRRFTLVVLAEGTEPGEAPWCGAVPCW